MRVDLLGMLQSDHGFTVYQAFGRVVASRHHSRPYLHVGGFPSHAGDNWFPGFDGGNIDHFLVLARALDLLHVLNLFPFCENAAATSISFFHKRSFAIPLPIAPSPDTIILLALLSSPDDCSADLAIRTIPP